jgi:FemAB family protein
MIEMNEIEALIKSEKLDAEPRSKCRRQWGDTVARIADVPTQYLEHLVNINSTVFLSQSDQVIEISLILYSDRKVCGVWPLFVDLNNKESIKSINDQFGGIVIPPLFVDNFPKKSARRIIKGCMRFLDRLARRIECEVWRTSELSGSGHVSQWHQIAMENNADLDRVNYELYVDLTLSIGDLRKSIRKSYKPLVSSGLKDWDVTVLDHYCEKTWNRFRELHKSVSGRVTRPIETWNMQHNAIESGDAFLVYVSGRDGEMVGGGLFDMSGNEANYSVATYKKSLSDQPLGHLVQYHALLTLKDKGRSRYYIGSRFYREDLPGVTEKQVNISSFKAGFSTFVLPRVTLKCISQRQY